MLTVIAKDLFEAFEKHGEELFLVGGSVRDHFIHQFSNDSLICESPSKEPFRPKDLDFATSALPEKTEKILKSIKKPVYPIGKEFGTIGTTVQDYDVEITTYRCEESYAKGNRRPNVTFGKTLEDDLKRRDFTINAMAMDKDGQIIDPFSGRQSCIEGLLLTPALNPKDIFMDDPLRMLRAYRFESQLNLSLCKLEVDMIELLKEEIHTVSQERIFQEMSKLLLGRNVKRALEHMGSSGLLGQIFPELQKVIDFKQNQGKWHSKLVWPHVLGVVENSPPILEVRWAALFHDIAKPETYSETETGVHFYQHEPIGAATWNVIADRLKVSSEFKREINYLIYHHLRFSQLCSVSTKSISKSAVRRFIRDCGEYMENLYHLSMADITSHHPHVVQEKRQKCIDLKAMIDDINKECDVKTLKLPKGLGAQIAKELKLPHGPELGRIMRQLTDFLVCGILQESDDFIAAAHGIKKKQDGLRELTRISQEMGGYGECKRSS